jgi:hypothetical protein
MGKSNTSSLRTHLSNGLSLHGPLVASSFGIGIGLFTHAAKTYSDTITGSRDSPYHYLTLIEQAGVIIRTDLRSKP